MKLVVAWPTETLPVIGPAKDAPPEPMRPHLERLVERGVPEGAHITERGARVGRRGHPYWFVAYRDDNGVAVRAVLLFVDVTFEVTVAGDPVATLAAIDDGDLHFDDEVASIHQMFREDSR